MNRDPNTPPGKKKVGIVVDNYKVDTFKKELEKKGYTDVSTYPFVKKTTQIHVIVNDADVETVRRLCVKLEHTIKRGMN
jgi:nitrogen regulatory protein PII